MTKNLNVYISGIHQDWTFNSSKLSIHCWLPQESWYRDTWLMMVVYSNNGTVLHIGSHGYSYRISLNRRRPRIVAVASKSGTRTRVRMISDDSHHASARRFFFLFRVIPTGLTPGLRGCAYYWQSLATIAVSIVPTLSSRRWCLQAFQRNKCRPRIVATQNEQRNK